MADEAGVMFTTSGKAMPLLIARWRAKGGLFGLQPAAVLIEQDLTATRYFRATWAAAFPDRRGLPFEALASREGRFTDAMLNVWL